MKSLNEIVYSILEFVSGFKVTDDNPILPELIAAKVHDVRALLIKQDYNSDKQVNDLFYQELILNIVNGEQFEPGKTGLYQAHVAFPSLLSNVGWANIKYLGKVNLAEKYNRRSIDGYSSARGRVWSQDYVDYTVIGNSKAIIRNEKTANKILMIGLFSDPTMHPDFDWDTEYPTPDPFKLEMIVKQDIMAGMGIPPDEKNDAKHNLDEVGVKKE